MENYLLFALLAVACGTMLPILFFGYRSTEEDRSRRAMELAQARQDEAASPHFLAHLGQGAGVTCPDSVDEAVVARVELHVRNERGLAAEFVSRPSAERLHRKPDGTGPAH